MRRLGSIAAVAAAACLLPASASASHGAYGCFDVNRAGGDGAEELVAAEGDRGLAAFGGDDRVVGTAGVDCASGGAGNDVLDLAAGDDVGFGRSGHDRLDGGAGNDRLFAGDGADIVAGGDGDDLLHDENGDVHRDMLVAGPGNDRVEAANGFRDDVDCGEGADVAVLDPVDVHVGCETLAPADRVSVTPGSGSRRTRFEVRYTGDYNLRRECNDQAGDAFCPGEGSVSAKLVGRPSRRRGCRSTAWDVNDLGLFQSRRAVRIGWRDRRARPCAGTYRWRLTYIGSGTWIDCDLLAERPVLLPGQEDRDRGVPYQACFATERIGEVKLRIR